MALEGAYALCCCYALSVILVYRHAIILLQVTTSAISDAQGKRLEVVLKVILCRKNPPIKTPGH